MLYRLERTKDVLSTSLVVPAVLDFGCPMVAFRKNKSFFL